MDMGIAQILAAVMKGSTPGDAAAAQFSHEAAHHFAAFLSGKVQG